MALELRMVFTFLLVEKKRICNRDLMQPIKPKILLSGHHRKSLSTFAVGERYLEKRIRRNLADINLSND